MAEILTLLLMPDCESTRADVGNKENEGKNTHAILSNDDCHGRFIELENGQTLSIAEGFFADILSETQYYLLSDEKQLEAKDDYSVKRLNAGRYVLELERNVIWKIEGSHN